MTIQNFTEHLSTHELEKGEDYFRRKKVTKLKQHDSDEWTATVLGRKPYEVVIGMEGEEITDVSCECVVHEEEDYCKHVIAVLFSIQQKEGILKTATSIELESIVNIMTISELRGVILNHARKDQSLKNILIALKESKDNEDKNINRYSALINQLMQGASGTNGAIAVEKMDDLLNTCRELIIKADKAYDDYKFTTSAEIALAVVKTLPLTASREEVVVSAIKDIIADGFDLLLTIVSTPKDIDDDTDDLILKHATRHVKDATY
jgi:uncharacterized Zn finger protein